MSKFKLLSLFAMLIFSTLRAEDKSANSELKIDQNESWARADGNAYTEIKTLKPTNGRIVLEKSNVWGQGAQDAINKQHEECKIKAQELTDRLKVATQYRMKAYRTIKDSAAGYNAYTVQCEVFYQ